MEAELRVHAAAVGEQQRPGALRTSVVAARADKAVKPRVVVAVVVCRDDRQARSSVQARIDRVVQRCVCTRALLVRDRDHDRVSLLTGHSPERFDVGRQVEPDGNERDVGTGHCQRASFPRLPVGVGLVLWPVDDNVHRWAPRAVRRGLGSRKRCNEIARGQAASAKQGCAVEEEDGGKGDADGGGAGTASNGVAHAHHPQPD
mmetsp:Transcript_7943/g.23496  ORF Transcript_7943/g.23496 Transcript_7943/m.23496 type:complete len:203 (+) Transcript_7943:1433-2041(+)